MLRRVGHPLLLVFLVLAHTGPGSFYLFMDNFFWWLREDAVEAARGEAPVEEVVLVLVDEQDLQEVPSRWPWNRRIHARGLDRLREAGAVAVALVVDLNLDARARRDREQDGVLREAILESGNVVHLGGGLGEARRRKILPILPYFREAFAGVGRPRPEFDGHGRLVGYGLDEGGLLGEELQGLGTLLALAGRQEAGERLRRSLDRRGAVRLPFHLEGRFRTLSWRELDSSRDLSGLAGKIVVLGAGAVILHDLVDTPVQGSMTRAETLGLALAGALRDELTFTAPLWADALLILVLAGLTVFLARRLEPGRMVLAAGVLAVLWWLFTLGCHALGGLVLPFFRPGGLVVLVAAAEILRQRSTVESEFQVTDPLLEYRARRRMDEAMAAMARGDYAEAAQELAEISQMETLLRARAEQRLVLALLESGRTMEAGVLVSALEFAKLEEEEIYLLARKLEEHDLKEEAKRSLEKLYLINPDFEDVRTRLAELRHELAGFTEDELVETIARRILDRRFDDVRLHAKGGVGFVFRVKDKKRRGEELALKILSPLQMNDPMVVTRFLREARSVARLEHPNVIRLYDVFGRSLPYYTMQYFDAPSLMERIDAAGRLAPDEVVPALIQACAGLGHAHSHGLVHRDVKPHNLLVATDGRVKVIDFGAARPLEDSQAAATGVLVGTPLYMAPEQVRGEPATPATDVYALGLVLYEALYGRLPFETMGQRVDEDAPRPEPEAGISEELVEVMMKALSRDQEARYQSMEELAKALEATVSPEDLVSADGIQFSEPPPS